jgi:hypothetical protein
MAQIGNLNKIINNTLGTSSSMNNNFDDIKTIYNSHDTATTGVHGLGSKTIGDYNTSKTLIDILVPVGSIIECWIPSDVSLTIDTDIWNELDGTTIADASSDFNTITLPDTDGRYLIGAGSMDTSGSITTDTISSTPVGNSNNLRDFTHSHTITHSHNILHTHGLESHTHSLTNALTVGVTALATFTNISGPTFFNVSGSSFTASYAALRKTGSISTSGLLCYNIETSGTTGTSSVDSCTYGSITTSEDATVTTSDGLTSDVDIKPKSLKVKRYIRYK